MDIYRGLQKYGFKPNLKHLSSYQLINTHQDLFKKYKIDFKIKDEYDLQLALVYYNGFLNKERCMAIHQKLINECHGLWESMNYTQRQVLFYGELEMMLQNIPHIYQENTLVLIPFFDKELNCRYVNDFQSLLLKKNSYLVNDFLSVMIDPIATYGQSCFFGGFSDFLLIKQIKHMSYFYLKDFQSIYIYNHHTDAFALKINITSKDVNVDVSIDDLAIIVDLMNDNDASGLSQFLYHKGYISSKVYKKINKKYIGG